VRTCTVPHTTFQPARRRILFFSRGRGYGHAIPDMAIADQLLGLQGDLDVRFASYGSGAQALHEHGWAVVDLDMPDANRLCPTIVKTGQVMREMQPCTVISHEEFTVLPVAKIFELPTIFITEWFSDPNDDMMQSLSYADQVIVTEDEGVFDEPPNVQGRVSYVGPVLRSFSYLRADRSRARKELGFPQHAIILLAIPGGWATEEKEPVSDVVLRAYDALRAPAKLLVWLAGADYENLAQRCAGRDDIIVKERDWQVDRLMVASDLAITKANRITIRELSAVGIPSISISHGLNPIDDTLIARIPTNVALDARTLSHKLLVNSMLDALRDGAGVASTPAPTQSAAALLAAQRIADRIAALSGSPARATTDTQAKG